MSGRHFPRLNPNGESWCAGDTRVYVDDVEIGIGRMPQWQDARTIIALSPAVGIVRYRLQETGTWAQDWLDRTAEANDLSVSAAGWAYYTTNPSPRVVTHDGRVFDGYGAPAMAPDGRIAMAKHADGSVWIAASGRSEATILTTISSRDLRWTDAGLSFTAYPDRQPEVWTYYDGTPMKVSVVDREYACAAVMGPLRLTRLRWVLSIDDARLLLRVDSASDGYVLATDANTFNPDVRWVESRQRFRVVAATKDGRVREWWVDPATDRVDLRRVSVPVPTPVPTPTPPPTPTPEPDMNTEYASFSWDRAEFNKCTEEVGEWPAVIRLEDAYVPEPNTKGIVTEWTNSRDWPSTDPGPGPGLVGNCAIVAKIDGTWRVATYDWLRYPDQDAKDESLTSVRREQVNEAPWTTWQPQVGEVVGLFVCAPARTGVRTVRERSAIAWVKIGQRGILALEGTSQPQPTPNPTPVPTPTPTPTPQPDPAILAAIADIKATVDALAQRVDTHTGVLTEWMVDMSGHVRAVGDTCDALMQDAHRFRNETAKQIENLSLPIDAETRFLNQRVKFSGTVGKK